MAEDILADEDYPQYPRSTMDGFAVNTRHGTKPRRVASAAVLMGRGPIEHMSVAEAVRIPTGRRASRKRRRRGTARECEHARRDDRAHIHRGPR